MRRAKKAGGDLSLGVIHDFVGECAWTEEISKL